MARTTPTVGLDVWNNDTDPYDHDQLAANWDAIDAAFATPSNAHGYIVLPVSSAVIGLAYEPVSIVANQFITVSKVVGDSQPLFNITPAGKLQWGIGGSTATDLNLYRVSTGLLATDQSFRAVTINATTGFQVNGTALAASNLSNGVTGTGAVVLAASPTFTGTTTANTLNPTLIQVNGDASANLYQGSSGVIKNDGKFNAVLGYQVNGVALAASNLSNGITGTGSVVLAASPTLSGTLTAVTITATTYQVGGTAFAASNLSNGTTGTGAVVLAVSPTFSGVPLAPTASGGTNTTQVATTAFVTSAVATLPTNSVSTAAIQSAAVTTAKLASVTGTGAVVLATAPTISALTITGSLSTGTSIVVDQSDAGSGLYWGSAAEMYIFRSASHTLTLHDSVYGDVLKILQPISASDTGLQLSYLSGSTPTLARVLVGPADSAGTGFRALRIQN